MHGPGKYDSICALAKATTGAESCVLIVLNGANGDGISCKATLDGMQMLPDILRKIADGLEKDIGNIPPAGSGI